MCLLDRIRVPERFIFMHFEEEKMKDVVYVSMCYMISWRSHKLIKYLFSSRFDPWSITLRYWRVLAGHFILVLVLCSHCNWIRGAHAIG